LSRHEIEDMPEESVQQIFSKHHIVVSDQFVPLLNFSEKGLKSLASLDKPITLHGAFMSLFASIISQFIDLSRQNDFKSKSRHKQGTLRDLLECHEKDLKIVNGLDFPMMTALHPPAAIASCLAAFVETLDLPLCSRSITFPMAGTRWGLAATAGAHHLWHIDCDGFGTYIDTQAGSKWWVVARPKQSSDFSSISLFTSTFEVDKTNEDLWILEAILLLPGSRL
jgi:hypothetical protein